MLSISDAQQGAIHRAACEFLLAAVRGREPRLSDPRLGGLAETMTEGVFVTIKRRGALRGCCGSIGKPAPLGETLASAARRAATQDYRLPPVLLGELRLLDVTVTILFGMNQIAGGAAERAGAVVVGRHGLYLRSGDSSGLLLPSVAVEHAADAEGFLEMVCRKAAAPPDAWRDEATRLFTFEGAAFEAPFDETCLASDDAAPAPTFTESPLVEQAESMLPPQAPAGPRPAGSHVRQPAVAGSFYPGDAAALERLLDDLFAGLPRGDEPWPAVMVPHAGLVFSGRIAARTLSRVRIPPRVIVIGPKHTRLGEEWAVAPHETWSLPGGDMFADAELARELAASMAGLKLDEAAHRQEHGVEVELPFIRRLRPDAAVVGIAIGRADLEQCRHLARGLAEAVSRQGEPPLLIISSDMNHFAADGETRRRDELALAALDRLDPAELLSVVRANNISMCGVLPAAIVLETLGNLGRPLRSERVAYGTSGDISGDRGRVVGYAGMLFGAAP